MMGRTKAVQDNFDGDMAQLAAVVVAMENVVEVGRDYLSHLKVTGRLSGPGAGATAGIVRATARALDGIRGTHPEAFGLARTDPHAAMVREAERGVKLAQARLEWAREYPLELTQGNEKARMVADREHELRAARNVLHLRLGEPAERAELTHEHVDGMTFAEKVRQGFTQPRAPKVAAPVPMAKDVAS